MTKLILCKECNTLKKHFAKGFCKRCYLIDYGSKYRQRPEVKERQQEYQKKPEEKLKRKLYGIEYRTRPGVKEKQAENSKRYHQQPKTKEKQRQRMKEYNSRLEIKKKKREYQREYWNRPHVVKKRKENPKIIANIGEFYNDFYKHFSNKIRTEDELMNLANVFSKNACTLSGRYQCELEERILSKIPEQVTKQIQQESVLKRPRKLRRGSIA